MKEIGSLEEIKEQKYFIFKHSLICPLSTTAFREVAAVETEMSIPVYIIAIQQQRDLSNQVASRFGIVHESPQLILVDDDHVMWSASHFNITADSILKAAAL